MDLQTIVLIVLTVMLIIKIIYLVAVKRPHEKQRAKSCHHSDRQHHWPR